MKQKKKINVRLLRRIQKHILAEPLRLDMMNFVRTDVHELFNPPCGTTGCIAGWCLMLNGSRAKTVGNMNMTRLVEKASNLLGLDYTPHTHDGYWSHWAANAEANNENSANLFLVEKWPIKFRYQYEEQMELVPKCETRPEAEKIQRRLAKITSQRIDHFIKTGE